MKDLSITFETSTSTDQHVCTPMEGKTIKSMKFDENLTDTYLVITCTDGTTCSIRYDCVYEYTIQQNFLENTVEPAITLTPIQLKVLRGFFNPKSSETKLGPITTKEQKELQELLEILGLTGPNK